MSDALPIAISILALIASALAAVYARWQATHSDRSNRISLQPDRLTVFNALRRFAGHLTARGPNIEEAEVWRFQEAADVSEFYFDAKVHKQLEDVVKRSLNLLTLNEEWLHAKQERNPEAKAMVEKRYVLHRAIRDDCYKFAEEMRAQLRVGVA